MKKISFILLIFLCFACKKGSDIAIAEVYGKKLYLSDIKEIIPPNLSEEDSVDFIQQYAEQWCKEKVILHEANKHLSFKERDFSKQIKQFREQLIINAYYDKITADSSFHHIPQREVVAFMEKNGMRSDIDKEIIKLNYVKLSQKSKLIPQIKAILFDDEKRISEKAKIEKLCGDSIEYYIEDDKWFYLDEIAAELPLRIANKSSIRAQNQYFEVEENRFHYLIVLLDYRAKQTNSEISNSEYRNVRLLLEQQRKREFFQQKSDQLYQKAKKEKKVIIFQ